MAELPLNRFDYKGYYTLIECEAAIKRLHDVYEYEFPTASGSFDEFTTKIVPCALRSIPPLMLLR